MTGIFIAFMGGCVCFLAAYIGSEELVVLGVSLCFTGVSGIDNETE